MTNTEAGRWESLSGNGLETQPPISSVHPGASCLPGRAHLFSFLTYFSITVDKILYEFQVYNIVTRHLHALRSDHPVGQGWSSAHPTTVSASVAAGQGVLCPQHSNPAGGGTGRHCLWEVTSCHSKPFCGGQQNRPQQCCAQPSHLPKSPCPLIPSTPDPILSHKPGQWDEV